MPVTDAYRDQVLTRLSDVHPIRHRAMFGGVGIWTLDTDLFFALIADDALYFKVDDETQAAFTERGQPQFMNMRYYRVPDDVLDDPEQLRQWSETAVTVAARAKK